MLIGYMRVFKADGSQVLDLQRDALIEVGVQLEHLYEDLAPGKEDDRPGLILALKPTGRLIAGIMLCPRAFSTLCNRFDS
jgi:hypothetical protein